PVKVSLKEPGYQKKIMGSWQALMPRVAEIKNRKGSLFYGVCNIAEGIEGDDCSFENIAGVEVRSAEGIPEGMKAQKVPAAKYFVVTHKGRVEKIGETYCEVEKDLKKLGLEEDRSKMFFELYDERFKENSDDSEFDIYSAIKG
ncbi:effector binding domain-containing protein, partial [Candidatus Woesearchaeota archaeon]|nr:effector binding domain-containing protein [Candidatus Woesearchaeota archaeon]